LPKESSIVRRPLLHGFLAGALLLTLAPAAAQAGSITYACPGGSLECRGQTFAVWLDGSGADYFDIAFSIDTTGFTGPPSYAFGVEVKDLYDSTGKSIYGSLSLTAAPGGTGSWKVDTTQLSQSCEGAAKTDTACAVWKSTGPGYGFAVGETLTWIFRIATTIEPDAMGHVKYWYKDGSGRKTAGLLSADLGIQRPTQVPEPGTLTFALFGLGAIGAALRKLKPASAISG
jgi:hypothetical protein